MSPVPAFPKDPKGGATKASVLNHFCMVLGPSTFANKNVLGRVASPQVPVPQPRCKDESALDHCDTRKLPISKCQTQNVGSVPQERDVVDVAGGEDVSPIKSRSPILCPEVPMILSLSCQVSAVEAPVTYIGKGLSPSVGRI